MKEGVMDLNYFYHPSIPSFERRGGRKRVS
jgi:hypothetical protein